MRVRFWIRPRPRAKIPKTRTWKARILKKFQLTRLRNLRLRRQPLPRPTRKRGMWSVTPSSSRIRGMWLLRILMLRTRLRAWQKISRHLLPVKTKVSQPLTLLHKVTLMAVWSATLWRLKALILKALRFQLMMTRPLQRSRNRNWVSRRLLILQLCLLSGRKSTTTFLFETRAMWPWRMLWLMMTWREWQSPWVPWSQALPEPLQRPMLWLRMTWIWGLLKTLSQPRVKIPKITRLRVQTVKMCPARNRPGLRSPKLQVPRAISRREISLPIPLQ